MNKKNIEVRTYDHTWPQLFESEAACIKEALGDNLVAVHHIGSTSVPGLAAKPKIDIIAAVKTTENIISQLENAGFSYRGEWNIPFKYGFTKRGEVDVNLHIFEEGHPEIELNLTFRDYLRSHHSARNEYASLKENLLQNEASFQKNNAMFPGYTLGKDTFIRKILKDCGFKALRFLTCTHHAEWEAAKYFRQHYFFDNVPVADPYTWTFNHPEHKHFILCEGVEIIGYAHIQLWPENRTALRIIVINEMKRNLGIGEQFLAFIEKWLKGHNYKSIHTESSPKALLFYEKNNYIPMPFNDPDNYESDPQDIPMGKVL